MGETSTEALFPGELPRGTLIAGYKVRQRIGAGPTGSVYAAVHPQSGHKVAIKLLHPHLAHRPEVLHLFEEQSQRIAALRHPGIIPLLEMGRLDDGQVYVISDYALGQPLTDLLASSGPLEPAAAQPLIEALAMVLAAAHNRQVVHGDLTPDNIWITPQESGSWPPIVRVMDFGMGLLRAGEEGMRRWLEELPYYASPEQCRGEAPQATADVYALGVIAYRMLTGRLPFSSSRPSEVVRKHLEEPPRPPSSLVPLSPALDGLLLKALAKDPAERFQSMLQLRDALIGQPSPEPESQPEPVRPESIVVVEAEPARPPERPLVEARAEPEPGSTGELPLLAAHPRLGWLLSAVLGLILALAAVLIGSQVLLGRFPWQSSAQHAPQPPAPQPHGQAPPAR